MGTWCLHASSFIFDRIIIKVAGNQDRHKSSDKFDFGPLVSMAHLYDFFFVVFKWDLTLAHWTQVSDRCPLGYLFKVFSSPEPSGSQGELIVYPYSGVRVASLLSSSSSTMFKHLLLRNRFANQSQILCGASLGRGNESLYKWSRSHDQDGRHAHIWLKPLKIFFSRTRSPMILKLGM